TQNSDILNNSLLQETNAGKNGHIVTLTSDLWYLSGGGLESTKLIFEEASKYAGQ
ncbi:MAG: ferrichrome ABC transporter substrate-binding protein, partial [Streptococcus thermophilus]|nr:ferrichrome ABC transporter substrate-binding protein [Streptococcus thermophilus]